MVWTAEGLCEFFKEPWNFLDWIIVALGWLSMTSLGANFGALRTIRLLRPLRTLKRIESMRKLINSLLSALPGLVNVGGMMFAFVFVMSLFGVKMFKGTMRFHCVPEDDYDGAVERALMYADRECEYLPRPSGAGYARYQGGVPADEGPQEGRARPPPRSSRGPGVRLQHET